MDNKEKYKLIVGLKELMNDTLISNIGEFRNSLKISLNASKIMKFIYDNDILTDFFLDRVNKFKKLKSDSENYKKTIAFRNRLLDECTDNKLSLNFSILSYIKHTYTDFITNDYIFKLITNFGEDTTYTDGIFDFIDNAIDYYIENSPFCFNNLRELKNDILLLENANKMYTYEISWHYDYFYIYNFEKEISIQLSRTTENLYTFIAYKKILNDLLQYVYEIELSKQEKEDSRKTNIKQRLAQSTIYFDDYTDLSDLTNSQRELLQCIKACITQKDLDNVLEVKGFDYTNNSRKQAIWNLSAYFKDIGLINKQKHKGGFIALKSLLDKHPEWSIPNPNKSK